MEHSLSKSEIEELKAIASKAVPYSENDPILGEYDGELDSDRVAASFAKRILDEYYAEQRKGEAENGKR